MKFNEFSPVLKFVVVATVIWCVSPIDDFFQAGLTGPLCVIDEVLAVLASVNMYKKEVDNVVNTITDAADSNTDTGFSEVLEAVTQAKSGIEGNTPKQVEKEGTELKSEADEAKLAFEE